jgi:hypothetical protein
LQVLKDHLEKNMADIKVNNLPEINEYEELSDLEVESVVGGAIPLAAVGLGVGVASLGVGLANLGMNIRRRK